MKISVDFDKCNGCRICEQICVLFHEGEFNPKRSRIRVSKVVREGLSTPKICNQCRECIDACPVDAISWDDALGIVRVDAGQCNGCGVCVESCPQEAIFMDPITDLALICDLCNGDPQCVKWCSGEGVLRYEPAGVPSS